MPYDIKQYSQDQAKKIGVIIQPSTLKNYKIDVFNKDREYITSIGHKSFSDFPHYIESHGIEYANKRRNLYHARHRKDDGIRGYLSKMILW